jgi:hypothetical protein
MSAGAKGAQIAANFGGVLMILVGGFSLMQGFAAIINEGFLEKLEKYAYALDPTAWGWIHLIVGGIVLLAGFYVFTDSLVARIIGIAAALLSAVVNFFWLPYYPLWSTLIIAMNIVVVWGLAMHRRDTYSP